MKYWLRCPNSDRLWSIWSRHLCGKKTNRENVHKSHHYKQCNKEKHEKKSGLKTIQEKHSEAKFSHVYKIEGDRIKAFPSFVAMVWVGLIMNKWVCFGGEAPHVQSDGGSLSTGAVCWGMMQYERSPWLPRIAGCLLCFPLTPLALAIGVLLCRLRLQHSQNSVEEVRNPSRLKGDGGIISSLRGRRRGRWTRRRLAPSHVHVWFILLMYQEKTLPLSLSAMQPVFVLYIHMRPDAIFAWLKTSWINYNF